MPSPRIREPVGNFPCFDHLVDKGLDLVNMLGDLRDRLHLVLREFAVCFQVEHLFQPLYIFDQGILVPDGDRYDMVRGKIAEHPRFDLDLLRIVLEADLLPCMEFPLGKTWLSSKRLTDLFGVMERLQGFRRGREVGKSAECGLFHPFVAVVVAFKTDLLRFLDIFPDHLQDGFVLPHFLCDQCIHLFLEFLQLVGHDQVEGDHRRGAGLEDPTARNSNLFPVKANGEVRFLSVLSSRISGIFGRFFTSSFSVPGLQLDASYRSFQ